MKYIVFVCIPFGIDDTYYVEYSGKEHTNLTSAKLEYYKAKRDDNVIYATIEEMED